MSINKKDFEFLPPTANAMVKADYDIYFELDGGMSVEVTLQCGEIVTYREGEDNITVWCDGPVTLHIRDEYAFDSLFQKVDLHRLPKNMKYYTFEGLYSELYEGWDVWIHDFESGNIYRTGVFIEKVENQDTGIGEEQYVLKILITAGEAEDGNIKCAVAFQSITFSLGDYGSKWAALQEQA